MIDPGTQISIWDQLPGLDPHRTPIERLLARIEPYETLAGPPRPEGLADPEPFAEDIRRRRRSWPKLLEPAASAEPPTSPWLRDWRESRLSVAAVALIGIVYYALHATLGLILLGLAVMVLVFLWRRSRRTRLRRALKRRLCPDCGYNLRGCPSGLDPGLLGLDPGPRRCPECGSAWPLLPPRPTPPPPSPPPAGPSRPVTITRLGD